MRKYKEERRVFPKHEKISAEKVDRYFTYKCSSNERVPTFTNVMNAKFEGS